MLFSVIKLIFMTYIIVACTNSFSLVRVQSKKVNTKTRLYSDKENNEINDYFIKGKKLGLKGSKLEEYVIEFSNQKLKMKNLQQESYNINELRTKILGENKQIKRIEMESLENKIEMRNLEIEKLKLISRLRLDLARNNLNITIVQREISFERLQRLQFQGLMNSRGIVEQVLAKVKVILNQKMSNSDALRYLGEFSLGNKVTNDPQLLNIVRLFKECGFNTTDDFTELYSSLSQEIHGDSWNGYSVKVYKKNLGPRNSCIVIALCELLLFEVDEID